MRLKNLFTVPAGQKVTERHLRRVLFSSICSILLCMTCLVSTTWAWFAVSIENSDNIIQIAEPGITLTVNGEAYTDITNNLTGNIRVCIEHANKEDDLKKKCTLYVTLLIECESGTKTVYVQLEEKNDYKWELAIVATTACKLSWDVSWFPPANAIALTDSTITLTAVESSKAPSTESSTEPTTESSTEPTTEPSTDPSTGPSTDPSGDSR